MLVTLKKDEKSFITFDNDDIKLIDVFYVEGLEKETIYVLEIFLNFGYKLTFKSLYYDRIKELLSILETKKTITETFELSKEFNEEYLLESFK